MSPTAGSNNTNATIVNSPLTNIENDVIYTVPIELGAPVQKFNVILDTGSPITWLSSSNCVSEACLTATRYHCESSTTCKVLDQNFTASYVSGQGVSGYYVAETFSIGSLQFRGALGVATQNKAQLPARVDGIMGLWYYAAGSVIPILNVLKNTTALQEDRIGIWLQSTRPHGKTNETATALGNYSAGGEITFGGVDASKFQGNFTYVDCVGLRPWTIPVGGVKVAGNNIKVDGAVAAIDTGTTAMLIPRTIADSINGAIPGAIKVATQGGTWYMPCNGNTDIVITFGNFSAKIPYSHVALQAARSKTQQGDYCLSAIMFPIGKTLAIQEWLIGDVFLKNVYSVFDFGTNASSGGRIGFAHLATEDMNSAISRMTRGSLVHLAVFVVLSTVYLLL